MADLMLTDITELAAIPADGDWVHVVDVSDTTDNAAGSSRKVLVSNLLGGRAKTDLSNLAATTAINSALLLATSDAAALGSATKQWADLFLAEGGVINWDNGDVTLTQTGNSLALAGGDFALGANNITGTGTANRWGTATLNDSNADTMFSTSGTGKKAAVFQGLSGQTVDILQVQDYLGNRIYGVYSETHQFNKSTAAVSSYIAEWRYLNVVVARVGVGGSWEVGNYSIGSTGVNIGGGYMTIVESGGVAIQSTYNELQFKPGGLSGPGTHRISIISQAAADIPFDVKGAVSQTGLLTRWVDSSGAVKLAVGANGSLQGTNSKSLTETTDTGFVEIAVASGASVAGFVEYTVEADDGTDFQIESGIIRFTAVNKAGTVTTNISATDANAVQTLSAGTLTNNNFVTTAGTLKFTLKANYTSSLTQSTLKINYRVHINKGTVDVTPL